MYLVVTIDTEEDNWGDLTRSSFSVNNLSRIPRLQEMFMNRGVRPTYLISYPIATSAIGIEMLGKYQEDGVCEVGTHPHPWNTPPLEEERTPIHSYICNLPSLLQYKKIKHLTETIESNFGRRPTSYRSGRWGFNEEVARNLLRLRYEVDTSIFPVWDWSPGPDFTSFSHEPFLYAMQSESAVSGTLLEVPATVDFLQTRRALASSAFQTMMRVPLGGRVVGGLRRLGVLNHVCLSPEVSNGADMSKLTITLAERGARVINMFFHSPSLLEGCTPFVRTPADAEAFVARIDRFLVLAQQAGFKPVTISELTGDAIGASRVNVLTGPESAAV